jgi:hypothetical protein
MLVDFSLETILNRSFRIKAVKCRDGRDRMIEFLTVNTKKYDSLAIFLVILFIPVLLIFTGCAGNYGRLQRSQEVDKIFKSYQVLPDHNYYYVGPDGRPDAIMGIQRDYTLETTQWTQFDPSDETLKTGVDSINFHHSTSVRYYPYGFIILDPEGKQVGIWYSIWDWTTVIMEKDNRIKVFPPAKKDPFGNGDQREKMKFD